MSKTNFEELQFETFTLDQIMGNPAIAIIGPRQSGKTIMAETIINHLNLPYNVSSAHSVQTIQELMDRQRKVIKEKKIDTRSSIIIDENISLKEQSVKELLYNGRHYNITRVLTKQFPHDIAPDLRANFDYIFLLGNNYAETQKVLYEHYGRCFPNFHSFNQVFCEMTKNFGCMVINNRVHESNISEKIFYYKAPICIEEIHNDVIECLDSGTYCGRNIEQFDLNRMVDNPAIVMIAKRGSGKTVVSKTILEHFNIPNKIIISKAESFSSYYGHIFPEADVYHEYKPEIIKGHLTKKILDNNNLSEKSVIVLDNCLSSIKSWIREQPILELLYNHKHYNTSYILTMQYPLGIPDDLRSGFDYVFLLADESAINQKKMYEQYGNMFASFEEFKHTFNEITKDFSCMVIDNRNRKIYSYKAPYTHMHTHTYTPSPYFGQYNNMNNMHNDLYDEESKIEYVEPVIHRSMHNNTEPVIMQGCNPISYMSYIYDYVAENWFK